jgi:hypothetical protein
MRRVSSFEAGKLSKWLHSRRFAHFGEAQFFPQRLGDQFAQCWRDVTGVGDLECGQLRPLLIVMHPYRIREILAITASEVSLVTSIRSPGLTR